MATDGNQYSTLEAVHYSTVPETDTSKQFVPQDGKVAYDPSAGIEVAPKHGGNGGNGYDEGLPEYLPANGEKTPTHRNRTKWIVIGAIIGVVVLGAVLGGVLGSVLGKNKKSSTSSATSGTPTTTGIIPSSTASAAQSNHNLAAVSFVDSKVNATRVYYQDKTGNIIEAATSASSSKWTSNSLGFSAMNGSALAAAASWPGFPLVRISRLEINPANFFRK